MEYKFQPIPAFRPYTRVNNLPLDVTSVFTTIEEAEEYAAKGTVAYPGQIIAVVYNIEQEVRFYGIVFNTDESIDAKYVLEKLGSGSTETAAGANFNYSGKYKDFDDLGDTEFNVGDLIYIYGTENPGYYIKSKTSWDPFNLTISFASETSDGIIKSEEYSSLINSNGKAGLYYSDGVKTSSFKNNKWVNLATDSKDSSGIEIPTVNKVLTLIDSKDVANAPVLTLTSNIETEYFYGENIVPSFTIKYNQRAAGALSYVTINRTENDSAQTLVAVINISQFTKDGSDLIYTFSDTITNNELNSYTGILNGSLKYNVVANYVSNELYSDGVVEANLSYNFYDYIEYGYSGQGASEYYKIYDSIKSFNISVPKMDNNKNLFNTVYFKVNKNKQVESIYLSTQLNVDISSIFDVEDIGDKFKYSFTMDNIYGFNNDVYFKVNFVG